VRQAFIRTLCNLAARDERIVLLTGDLGYMVMEPFRERFPSRFINVGVAEQNMIGLATGMAEAGLRPYAYSIATFVSLRPLEFIRNGPVLHHLPVRIVGMGMGFDYGHAGPTHHALEDVAIMRTLPGLTVVVPADSVQAGNAIRETASLPGPVYYSLGKDDQLTIPAFDGHFELGRLDIVRHGKDVAILAMGSISVEAIAAAQDLAVQGIETSVALVSSFHPDPYHDTTEFLSRFSHVITVEAQTISGGLASFVGRVIATEGLSCRLRPLAIRTSPDGTSGNQAERWRKYGLDKASIFQEVRAAVRGVRSEA
jgi:transketolase